MAIREAPDLRGYTVTVLPGSFLKCDPPVLVVMVKALVKVVAATPRIRLCKLSLSGASVLLLSLIHI